MTTTTMMMKGRTRKKCCPKRSTFKTDSLFPRAPRASKPFSLSLFLFLSLSLSLSLSLKQAYVEKQPKIPLFLFSDRTETRQKKLESLLELLCRWPLAILWPFVVDFCFSDLPFSECKKVVWLPLTWSIFLSVSLSLSLSACLGI